MFKKTIFILFVFLFLFSYHLVFASPIINEFMYDLDDADIDWVEIYNGDSNDIDLSTLKLLISNSTSNHGIVLYSGSEVLHQGEYGIIVPTSQISSFISKWGSSGNLFTASFTLPNVEDGVEASIEINNGDKDLPIDSVSYDMSLGAKGDGNSLQLINNLWQSAIPTPNATNQVSPPPTVGGGEVSGSSTNEDTQLLETPSIKTHITAQTIAFIGFPVKFEASATGYAGEKLFYGTYFWNFGDGDSKEMKINDSSEFTHTFFYEGEYTVSLDYYSNYYLSKPDASDQIYIKVVKADVLISNVGDENDFFIEISNNTNYDVDLSGWILSSDKNIFTLPKNTILASKKKIILSPKITGFSIEDKNSLKLLNKQWEEIFNYSAFFTVPLVLNETSKTVPKNVSIIKEVNLNNQLPIENLDNLEENINTQIPTDYLLADVSKIDANTENNFNYGIFGLIIFIGFSASLAYFIRNHNREIVPQTAGDDFEIIDE